MFFDHGQSMVTSHHGDLILEVVNDGQMEINPLERHHGIPNLAGVHDVGGSACLEGEIVVVVEQILQLDGFEYGVGDTLLFAWLFASTDLINTRALSC